MSNKIIKHALFGGIAGVVVYNFLRWLAGFDIPSERGMDALGYAIANAGWFSIVGMITALIGDTMGDN